MAGKELNVFDVRELIRRLRLNQKDRAISREMDIDRKTVRRYRELAEENEWLVGETLPNPIAIAKATKHDNKSQAPQEISLVLPHKALVEELLKKPGMTATVIHQRLLERGFHGSYSSVYRFVSSLRQQEDPEGFCRLEVEPGSEAQVDFGSFGMLYDPVLDKERRAWAFVMTLSHSRHMYVEVVFDQSSWTWLRLHKEAFRFFGGVPGKIVLDNLKAAIIKAAAHDPLVQRSYRDLAEHYGFVVDPNRPRTPRHKGKVERSVLYYKQNFLPGREFQDLGDANEQVLRWVEEVAGKRIHGTTGWRPLERFEQIERAALRPLPVDEWELATWKEAKLHSDCYIHLEKSFYSAPFRFIGQKLLARISSKQVSIFHDLDLVATHDRATIPRSRKSNPDHFPPDKVRLIMATPQWCLKRAEEIGPATLAWIERYFANGVTEKTRSGFTVLELAKKYTPSRLEAACQRSLDFDEVHVNTIKQILSKGLDQQSWQHLLSPAPSASILPFRYARKSEHFFKDTQEASQ